MRTKTKKNRDTRVDVPLNLNQNELFKLMKLAHEQDITLNQLVESILRCKIDEVKV
jgi:hypothetical protein